MEQEDQQSKIKYLISRGKEQGYLTFSEINDYLPSEALKSDQIETIISKINDIGIKVVETDLDDKDFVDSDAEDIIEMINDMTIKGVENLPDADKLNVGGFVEIRDHSIWLKHIYDAEDLQKYLLNLKEKSLIELEIDGVRGHWIKMSNGKDGRPTNGIKPIGKTKSDWSKIQSRRGDIVSIKKV